MKICENLKELRLENNLTQEQIAKILKVSRVVYNRYENGKREISVEFLIILADYYQVTLDYIAGRE